MKIPFNDVIPLPELAAALERRYPGVAVLWAFVTLNRPGYQDVRFSAPLKLLKQYGLVTDAMVAYAREYDARRRRPRPPRADGFFLRRSLNSQSQPGCWDLSLSTQDEEDPRERISGRELTQQMRRELDRIAKAAARP